MRTLAAALTSAQKQRSFSAEYKIVLTYPSATTVTYEQDRILPFDHTEEPYSQTATIPLDNSDLAVTTDFLGYKGVISYGLGGNYSPTAPLWVTGQQDHSSAGQLTVTLTLRGTPDLLADDHASKDFAQLTADTKTVKDVLTEVVKGVLPVWTAATVYALGDLVIAVTTNGKVFKVTTAGTSHSWTEPTWDTDIGDTTTDNTVSWTCMGDEMTCFSHTNGYTPTFDSEDDLLDSFKPKDIVDIRLNDSRLQVIKELIAFTKCAFRVEDDGEIHFFVPRVGEDTWAVGTAYTVNDYVLPTSPNNNFTYQCTTAGTSHASTEPTWPTTEGGTVNDNGVVWTARGFDYEYKLDVYGEHELVSKVNRTRFLTPNKVTVKSPDDSDDSYTGSAEDTASSDLSTLEKEEYHALRVTSNAEAASLAAAQLLHYQLDHQKGAARAPINVGQEVYDYVKVTDKRRDDLRIGNVGHIRRYAGGGRWDMDIAFGDSKLGGLVSLTPVYAGGVGGDATPALPDLEAPSLPSAPAINIPPTALGGAGMLLSPGVDPQAIQRAFQEISQQLQAQREYTASISAALNAITQFLSQSQQGVAQGFDQMAAYISAGDLVSQLTDDQLKGNIQRLFEALQDRSWLIGAVIDIQKDVRALQTRVITSRATVWEPTHVTVTAATYTVKDEDDLVGVDRAGAVTITLPAAAEVKGRVVVINDESNAAATNNITVDPAGSTNINDSATYVLNTNSESVGFYYSDNDSQWHTV